MTGIFRMIIKEKFAFEEFLVVMEENSGLILGIEHFDSHQDDWEGKYESTWFPLVKLIENKVLHGLTFHLTVSDYLTVFIISD
jgi:hypothetical protein